MSFSKLICPMNDDARHIIRGLELEAEWLREHVSSLNQTWKVEREHNNNLENQLSDMQNQLGWETENRGAARKELHAVKQQLHAVKQELYAVKRELAKSRKEVKSVEEDRSWLNAVLDSVRKEMNVSDKNPDNFNLSITETMSSEYYSSC